MKQPENQSKKYSVLFHDIDEGRIKIPQFQREFVWGKAKTATLVDSILKGFPIGTFILWKTKERLRHMRDVAGIKLKEPDKGDPIQYVLDGQQRVTSLYAIRKGARITREGHEINYKDISIDLTIDPESDEDLVFDTPPEEHDYISVHTLLNASVSELVEDYREHIDNVSIHKENLERYDFSVVIIDEYPIDIACEVFTRINTGGEELSLFEIMVAKTYDQEHDFDLAERYRQLMSSDGGEKSLETAGYDTIPPDTILQCVAAIVCDSIRRQDILRINRAEFIEAWDETKSGVFSAIDYLRTHLGVAVSRILPYNVLLVPFSWFFYKKKGKSYSNKEHRLLRQYFYWASLTNRFNSGVGTKIEADLGKMAAILAGNQPKYDNYELSVRAQDLEWTWFSVGNALCRAIICLLSEKKPQRLSTNGQVQLDNSWLKASSSKNYHHFFPRAHLKREGYEPWEANSIVNIVLVDDHLNKRVIGAKAPSIYMKSFQKENQDLSKTLRSHYIGSIDKFGISNDDYETFVSKRAKRIAAALNHALNPIKREDSPTSRGRSNRR